MAVLCRARRTGILRELLLKRVNCTVLSCNSRAIWKYPFRDRPDKSITNTRPKRFISGLFFSTIHLSFLQFRLVKCAQNNMLWSTAVEHNIMCVCMIASAWCALLYFLLLAYGVRDLRQSDKVNNIMAFDIAGNSYKKKNVFLHLYLFSAVLRCNSAGDCTIYYNLYFVAFYPGLPFPMKHF